VADRPARAPISCRLALALALCALSPSCNKSTKLQIQSVSPTSDSARGGTTVVVAGAGFEQGAEVLFGASAATKVHWAAADRLEVVTPRVLAASVDVTVRNPSGDSATLPGAFAFLPLELQFVQAPAHYLPALETTDVADAVAADLDRDGDTDVVVAVRGSAPRVLLNAGTGSLTGASSPAGADAGTGRDPSVAAGDTRKLVTADFDEDGDADVFTCNGSGQASRLLLGDGRGGLAEAPAGTVPSDAEDCRHAVATDLDGDGHLDIALAGAGPAGGGKGYVRVLRRGGSTGSVSFAPVLALEPDADSEGRACGNVVASKPEVSGTFTITLAGAKSGKGAGQAAYDFAQADGALRYELAAPRVAAAPEALELELWSDGSGHLAKLRLKDARGEVFTHELDALDWSGWKHVRADGIGSWAHAGGDADGVVDLPVAFVALEIEAAKGPKTGEVRLDDVRLEVPGTGLVLVDDFERKDFALAWEGELASIAAGDLDGDGDPDLVVSAEDTAAKAFLRVVVNDTARTAGGPIALRESASSALGTTPDPVAATVLFDADGDGRLDVIAVSKGQDRLFVNDGTGHFFDDTASAMPVDRSDGRSAAAADMNLDGKLDLVIANRASVNRLYLSRGKRGFEDVTPSMPLVAAGTLAIVPLDLERDGDLDLFVLVAKGEPSMLYVSTDRSEKR
jgi:hypothetical protein